MTVAPLHVPTPHAHKATPRTYLMCPPRHFTVSYAINPWMDPTRPVDTDRALRQWTALRDTYRGLGHTVHEIEPQSGLPDMVFAANAATVIDGRVFGARFRAAERQLEAAHYERWFASHGYDVVVPAAVAEGEGDFVWTGEFLLAGTGFRTDPAAHAHAQEVLGVPVVALQLVDPRYYHLDTALFVLEPATPHTPAVVAYYPEAFSAGSQQVLGRLFADAVLATAEDAAVLGLNGVSDGHNVVLPDGAYTLAAELSERGYHVHTVDMSELLKSGGGPKCCTLEIRS